MVQEKVKSPMLAKFPISSPPGQAPAPVAAHGVLGLDADHWAEARNPCDESPHGGETGELGACDFTFFIKNGVEA